MNTNKITTEDFSNRVTKEKFEQLWNGNEDELLTQQYQNGLQCGGCSYYAQFNEDYGLCCNKVSTYYTETVFEHFTCTAYEHEGWGPHSFTNQNEYKCHCQGIPIYRSIEMIISLIPPEGDTIDDELRSHLRVLRKYIDMQRSNQG